MSLPHRLALVCKAYARAHEPPTLQRLLAYSPFAPNTRLAVTAVLNISCYKFVPLPDAAQLREPLRARAVALGLKGTILLAEEGINFFLAGDALSVRGFVEALRGDERFADLDPKESWSDTVPFRKMLVKVKREIIRMDHPTIRPAQGRAPSVDPATLRRWPGKVCRCSRTGSAPPTPT